MKSPTSQMPSPRSRKTFRRHSQVCWVIPSIVLLIVNLIRSEQHGSKRERGLDRLDGKDTEVSATAKANKGMEKAINLRRDPREKGIGDQVNPMGRVQVQINTTGINGISSTKEATREGRPVKAKARASRVIPPTRAMAPALNVLGKSVLSGKVVCTPSSPTVMALLNTNVGRLLN